MKNAIKVVGGMALKLVFPFSFWPLGLKHIESVIYDLSFNHVMSREISIQYLSAF